MQVSLLFLIFVAVTAAPDVDASSGSEVRAQRGRTFAQTSCAQCHAVGPVGESPLLIAPPFRTLHQKYPVENLEEAFSEGITTGHPTMPEFRLDVAQINDLIAYLKTLERSR